MMNNNKRIASRQMYLAAFSALAGGAAAGAIICWSGAADTELEADKDIKLVETSEIKTWIDSSIALAALIGSLVCSVINRLLGLRRTLICVSVPVIVGWTLIAVAKSTGLILVGRIITGFCIGIYTTSAPAYVSDIVTPSARGFLGSCFQLILCVGQLALFAFACILPWRILSVVGIVPAVLCSLGMFFFGMESPFELVKAGHTNEALEALKLLRNSHSDIIVELAELEKRVVENSNAGGSTTQLLQRPDVWRPLVITLALMFFQQFSGINAVMFNLGEIFKGAGSSLSSNVSSLIVSAAMVVATFLSSVFMDRFGRRFLLQLSGAGHVVTLALMGIYYWKIMPHASWLPVLCLALFVIFFSFGYGPIPWMIAGEITPSEAKPLVSSIGSTFNWLCAFTTTKFFNALEDGLTVQGTYWFFGVCSCLGLAYVQVFVLETKGKTIQQIQEYFKSM